MRFFKKLLGIVLPFFVMSCCTVNVFASFSQDISNKSILYFCFDNYHSRVSDSEHTETSESSFSQDNNESSNDYADMSYSSNTVLQLETVYGSDLIGLSPEEAIEKVAPIFVANQQKTGLLASVGLAQFTVESGFGQSELSTEANNVFGMKSMLSNNTWSGSVWDGSVYTKETSEQMPNGSYKNIIADFRKYESINQCVDDRSAYLAHAETDDGLRYPGICSAKTYDEAIQIIVNGHYATSHTYFQKLSSNVEKYNLTKYDTMSVSGVSDSIVRYDALSDINRDRLIVIDAGHQRRGNSEKEPIGPNSTEMKAKVTSGTTGVVTGIPEYELTLTVANQLKDELSSRGYNVLLIRDSNDVNISNVERANMANDAHGDVFIRLHANGAEDNSKKGAMTICQTNENPYNASLHDDSYDLSKCVLDGMCAMTGAVKERVWETDTMSGINWSKIPVTILEMGYMTNSEEDQNLNNSEYQHKMCIGIADGIDKYFANR